MALLGNVNIENDKDLRTFREGMAAFCNRRPASECPWSKPDTIARFSNRMENGAEYVEKLRMLWDEGYDFAGLLDDATEDEAYNMGWNANIDGHDRHRDNPWNVSMTGISDGCSTGDRNDKSNAIMHMAWDDGYYACGDERANVMNPAKRIPVHPEMHHCPISPVDLDLR